MYSVSVIMPVNNDEEILESAIQSILSQSINGLELILINDGSTDLSARICDEFVKKEPLIVEFIDLPSSKGLSEARNQGLLRAKGKYVYFADVNNTFDKKMLEANINLAEEKETDMVVFGFTLPNEKSSTFNQVVLPNLPFLSSQEQFRRHFRNFYHFYPYALFNKIYRRDYLVRNRASFINAPTREDAFFNLRVYKNITSVAFNRTAYCSPHKNNLSPSRIYQDSHFKTNLKLASYFKAIMRHWQYEDEFEDLIAKEFIDVVLNELEVVCHENSAFSTQEQIDHINAMLKYDEIAEYLSNSKIRKDYTPYQRALLTSLSEGDSNSTLQTIKTRNNTRSKTSGILRLFRSFIGGHQ